MREKFKAKFIVPPMGTVLLQIIAGKLIAHEVVKGSKRRGLVKRLDDEDMQPKPS